MKSTFDDFIKIAPNYKKFEKSRDAKYIFENILSKDENIILMIDLSEFNKPALCACVKEVEDYFCKKSNSDFDLNDNFTKQALGTMVKVILDSFGYKPKKTNSQKEIPKSYQTKYLRSATVYELSGNPKMKVVRTIESV